MSFLYPGFLWLLIPLAIVLVRGLNKIVPTLHVVILILIVITLSRPVEEQALQEVNVKAKDIIIALDVSYSMRATDLSPTRYDFAKETIKVLLEKNPSDNIMLIAFTTNPLLLSPPTTDHTLINIALQSLTPEYILTKGTSLETLFKKLVSMDLREKNVILITDGGEESKLNTLTPLLVDANVPLTVLALGSTHGTTIQHKNGALLKDKQGNLVVSRINPLLEALAASVQGEYLTASDSPQQTANNIDNLLRQHKTNAQLIQKMQRNYKEWYQFPLVLAMLLFLMLHTRAIKYLIILFTFLGLQAEASFFDGYYLSKAYNTYEKKEFTTTKNYLKNVKTPSLQSKILLANTYYKAREFKHAIKLYKSIRSTSPTIKQQLYYNIANAYTQLASYDKAKIYYTKTLQLGEDVDARYNLTLIALLKNKNDASVGIAHPKSQSASSSNSESQEKDKDKEETRSEDKPSSGSGAGESSTTKKQEQSKLTSHESAEQQPLGSKVYELINKGYIRETQPW